MSEKPKGFVAEHDQQEHDAFVEHFPGHEAREETKVFAGTKHHLEKELGLGCAVCLMQNLETLIAEGKLPADPGDCALPSGVKVTPLAWYLRKAGELGLYPAHDKPVESHHFAIEWAHFGQTQAQKPADFLAKVRAFFARVFGKPQAADYPLKVNLYAQLMDWYGLYAEGLATGRPPISSPDDDRTQLILCEKHHRAEGFGVHHVPFPAWSAQLVIGDGEEALEPVGGYHGEKAR